MKNSGGRYRKSFIKEISFQPPDLCLLLEMGLDQTKGAFKWRKLRPCSTESMPVDHNSSLGLLPETAVL
jgi:hypothetical protein